MTDLDRLKEVRSHLRALLNTTQPAGPPSKHSLFLYEARQDLVWILAKISEKIGDSQ